MKYQAPYGVSDTNAPYVNGDPSIGRQGSIPPAAAFEENQRELVNFITLAGQTPNGGSQGVAGGDLYQVAKAVQSGALNFAVDTGTQNAMAVALPQPLLAYNQGLPIRVQILHSNINDATHTSLTLDGGAGPAAVVRADGAMPATNEMIAGGIYEFVFAGAKWHVTNFLGGGGGSGGGATYNVNIPYVRDTGTVANALRAIYTPAITAVTEGMFIAVKLKYSLVTGPCTIAINALPTPYPIVHPDGSSPNVGDAVANQTLLLCYDGVNGFQIIAVIGQVIQARPSILATVPYPGGQYLASWPTLNQINSMNVIIQNTLVTSTWDGSVLKIGAGEDGLWSFSTMLGIGNQPSPHAIQSVLIRQRASVNSRPFCHAFDTYSSIYMAEVTCYASDTMELAVGDQVFMWGSPQSSGGPFQNLQGSAITGYDLYPNFAAHLVSRHL
jgi:hypothetical protein